MSDLEFGQRVRLSHVVERHYVTAHTERVERPAPTPDSGPFVWEKIHDDGPLQFRPKWGGDEPGPDGIPGLPLSDPSPLPERKGTYRMLRRHPREVSGVVVGRTWRAEGTYHEGYFPGPSFFGEPPDPDPPYLEQSRRVEVVQVARDPGDVGARPWPADVVLAVPEDVEVQAT